MKNFPKTIACLSMSLLTIGAMAQSPKIIKMTHKPNLVLHHVGKGKFAPGSASGGGVRTHSVSSTPLNGQLNYPFWDYEYNSASFIGGLAADGWYTDLVNMHYDLSDTTSGTAVNYDLIHSYTVVYDTMWEYYSQVQYSPNQIKIQNIDTVWVLAAYKNYSGKNDTIVVQGVDTIAGNDTTTRGYPGTRQLFADTMYLGPDSSYIFGAWYTNAEIGTYYNDSLDYLFYLGVLPNYTPSHNPFGVTIMNYGSKLDTFEIADALPYFDCSPYYYANKTSVGIPLIESDTSAYNYANTFTTGWDYVLGSVNELPSSDGGYVWFGVTSCGDSGWMYEQDAAIYASFTYNIGTTGINNITESGFSVGQNYPNPFNKETQITYSLTKSEDVTFSVYDMTGRVLLNNVYTDSSPGQHTINLNANSFSPGVYFYTFNVGGTKVTNKMVITE